MAELGGVGQHRSNNITRRDLRRVGEGLGKLQSKNRKQRVYPRMAINVARRTRIARLIMRTGE